MKCIYRRGSESGMKGSWQLAVGRGVRFVSVFCFIMILFAINACHSDKSKKQGLLTPDVPEVGLSIKRYEKDLFGIDQSKMTQEVTRLAVDYRFFLGNNPTEPANLQQLRFYLNDPSIMSMFHEVMRTYPDMNDIQPGLTRAFSLFHHYFPEKRVPAVFTYISGLDYENPVRYLDSVLIIALDMYLGKDCKFYKALQVPVYKSLSFSKEYLAADCMKQVAFSMLPDIKKDKTLLDWMIAQGKLLYFADATLPGTADEIKIAYTPEQIEWCRKNAGNIWSFFVANKLFYNTDSKQNLVFI
jgi:hypothetical protein